jgi:hypothetical protein
VFRKFFSALAALAANVEALAASFAEANQRFRHNVLGDGNGDTIPALDYAPTDGNTKVVEPAPKNGRKRSASAK